MTVTRKVKLTVECVAEVYANTTAEELLLYRPEEVIDLLTLASSGKILKVVQMNG